MIPAELTQAMTNLGTAFGMTNRPPAGSHAADAAAAVESSASQGTASKGTAGKSPTG